MSIHTVAVTGSTVWQVIDKDQAVATFSTLDGYTRQNAEAEDITRRFAKHGILALWGGGSRSKGHGFWLYQTTIPAIEVYNAARGYCEIPGRTIENNGFASGNPHFWMMKDALRAPKVRSVTRNIRNFQPCARDGSRDSKPTNASRKRTKRNPRNC